MQVRRCLNRRFIIREAGGDSTLIPRCTKNRYPCAPQPGLAQQQYLRAVLLDELEEVHHRAVRHRRGKHLPACSERASKRARGGAQGEVVSGREGGREHRAWDRRGNRVVLELVTAASPFPPHTALVLTLV